MKLFSCFCSSILLVFLCDGAALRANERDPKDRLIPREITKVLPYLSRENQVYTILHFSANFNTIQGDIAPSTRGEFVHELVLFNQPELDEAFGFPLDRIVDAVEQVVVNFIACREKPYCKYLPRGLRNDEGQSYAMKVIAEFMRPDGQINENIFRWYLSRSLTCFLDDFSVYRGTTGLSISFQVLARPDKSAIMLSRSDSGAFTFIPFARMLLRVVSPTNNRTTVELWHADSIEPQILYDERADPQFVEVAVEISPNHQEIIVFITARIYLETEGRVQRTYVKKVFNTDYKEHMPLFEEKTEDSDWQLFDDIRELGGVKVAVYRDVHAHIFTPLETRNAVLLTAFMQQVRDIEYPHIASPSPQQIRLRKIYNAGASASNDYLLALIKDFLKGRAYQTQAPFANTGAIERIIQRTIAGQRRMYQLSAQEFWDTSIRG